MGLGWNKTFSWPLSDSGKSSGDSGKWCSVQMVYSGSWVLLTSAEDKVGW